MELTFFDSWLKVSMHSKDVFRDHPVPLLVDVVRHDEEKIESGEKGVGKSDVSMRILVNVVLCEEGRGEDAVSLPRSTRDFDASRKKVVELT